MVSCVGSKCNMDKYCPDFQKCVFNGGLEAAAQDRNYYDSPGKVTIAEGQEFVVTDSPALYVQFGGRAYRKPQFAIISTNEGYKFGKRIYPSNLFEYTMNTVVYTCFESSDMIIAFYNNSVHCKQQLAKAQAVEKSLRPMWQAALEHAKRLEIIMVDQVLAIARDNEIK